MDSTEWLAQGEGVSHHARMRRAVALGRQAKTGDPDARAIIEQLSRGDVYARRLAIATAFTSGDGARVLAALADPSRTVRSLAMLLVSLACDDDQALVALRGALEMGRERALLASLARRGRRAPIDRFLAEIAARTDVKHFADLLPFGSPRAVELHADVAFARPSTKLWSRLASGHPRALAKALDQRVRGQEGVEDDVTRLQIAAHLCRLAQRAPDETLSLVEALIARGRPVDSRALDLLAAARPAALAATLERFGLTHRAPVRATKGALEALSDEAFAALVRQNPRLISSTDAGFWRTASESRVRMAADAWAEAPARAPRWGSWALARLKDGPARERAYGVWTVAMRDERGAIATSELEALPDDLAEREAWRHVREVSALHTRPQERAQYARFLSWNDAATVCADLLAHPEGEQRAVALAVLLARAGRAGETSLVEKALALITARKFEQDPVRAVMLQSLSVWPKQRLALAPLATLERAVRDALDASDLSDGTAAAAEKLVLRSFYRDPAWGARWLATLLRERGRLYDYNLGAHLGPDEVRAASETLLVLAREWSARERSAPLVLLCASLGDRLSLSSGLPELMREQALESAWPEVSLAMTSLLAQHAYATIEPAFEQVFSRWIERRWFSTVNAFGHRARLIAGFVFPRSLVEALEHVARQTAYAGEAEQALLALRFGARDEFERRLGSILEADPSMIALGTARSHAHLRRQELLAPYFSSRKITGRFASGMTAWVLLFRDGMFRWTPAMNEAYARSLDAVLSDDKRDTPALIAALETFAALPYADLAPLCARASDARPAVQEKAIRVLARCDAGQGVDTLVACLGDARARVAIYGLRKALSDMPPTEALSVIERAPMQKVTVAKEVLRLLGELRSEAAYARLIAMDQQPSLHRDVRIAFMRALWPHLSRPEPWAVYERAVREGDWITASRVGDVPANYLTAESDRRLSALLATVLDRPDVEARLELLSRAQSIAVTDPERLFLRAITRRMASPYADEVTAATTAVIARARDQDQALVGQAFVALSVDRRAFREAIDALLVHSWWSASKRRMGRAVLDALSGDPRHSATCARIAGRALDALEFARWIERQGTARALHMDALTACREGLTVHEDELETLLPYLAKSVIAEARRVAVWALEADVASNGGWTLERLAMLRALRDDADPMVSAAALSVLPPREVDPG